jgi:hypothetical protein
MPLRGKIPMNKPPFCLFLFVSFTLFAIPITLRAQAAVEYGLKSAGGALSSAGGTSIAGCNVDSALLTCLSHSYPQTAIIIAVVICLLIARWLYGQMGYSSH